MRHRRPSIRATHPKTLSLRPSHPAHSSDPRRAAPSADRTAKGGEHCSTHTQQRLVYMLGASNGHGDVFNVYAVVSLPLARI